MVWTATILILLALGFVFFVRPTDIPAPIPLSPVAHLDDRKQAIYDNLRDLQFEYRLGKLSDEDYQGAKISLQKELAGVLSETDAILATTGTQRVRPPAVIAKVKTIKAETPTTTCSACGAKFKEALKFCGSCGKLIA